MTPRQLQTKVRFGAIATLIAAGALFGCNSGHGRHTSEGLAMAQQRLSGFKAGAEWDMAHQQYLSGELDKALRTVDKSISLNDSVAKSHTLRARILLEMGRLEDALESVRTARTIDPSFVDAHYFEGVLLERFSDYEGGLACFAQAASLDPSNAQYAVATAEMLIEMGRLDEAQRLLETSRSHYVHSAGVRQTLGHLAMMRSDPTKAADLFAEARLLAPDDAALAEDLARALIACERFGEAELLLARLLSRDWNAAPAGVRSDPTNDRKPKPVDRRDLEHLRARCLIALDRPSEARNVLLGLTQGQEGAADGPAWIALGQVAYKLGDQHRMRIAANRAIALEPNRPEGRMLLAAYRLETGDLPGALRAAQEAMHQFPDDPGPRTLAAVVLREMGRDDDAAQTLAGALRLDPTNPHATSVLAAVESER